MSQVMEIIMRAGEISLADLVARSPMKPTDIAQEVEQLAKSEEVSVVASEEIGKWGGRFTTLVQTIASAGGDEQQQRRKLFAAIADRPDLNLRLRLSSKAFRRRAPA